MLTFNRQYFFGAVFLFLVEVMIALFVQDQVIRPYGGDFLVVIFLYCLLKSFFEVAMKKAILLVLCFAYLVEFSQYLELSAAVGLGDNPVASVVLGNSFEWLDMLIYTLGALTVLLIEQGKKMFTGTGSPKMRVSLILNRVKKNGNSR